MESLLLDVPALPRWGVAVLTGGVAGAASLPHCIAMCGPLVGVVAGPGAGRAANLRYQAGRVLGYAALGMLAGRFGAVVTDTLGARATAGMAALSAVALAWLALRLWAPRWRTGGETVRLRRGPPSLMARALRRARALLPRDRTALGACSALLPCGALYAALLLASTGGSGPHGALLMGAFALVSAGAFATAGSVLARLKLAPGAPPARALSLVLLLGAGAWMAQPWLATPAQDAPTANATAPRCH